MMACRSASASADSSGTSLRPTSIEENAVTHRQRIAFKAAPLLFGVLAIAACATQSGSNVATLTAADYAPFLADPARPEADKNDDAARKPAEVLAFAQIRPGDTVLEMEAGRGWYSDLLSSAIGPSGKLIVQYPPQFNYGDAAFKARTDAGRLKNATITVTAFDKLQAPDNSVDKVLWLAAHTASFRFVLTMLGDNAFTRMPCGARSLAAHCMKLISPAFAAL